MVPNFLGHPVECSLFRLSVSEEIMTLTLFVLIQYNNVPDGQTDRRISLLWQYQRLHSLLCYRADTSTSNAARSELYTLK